VRRRSISTACLALLAAGCTLRSPATWAGVEEELRAEHPDVPRVDDEELAARLADPEGPLLLDARSAEEFAVSRIPGARSTPTPALALAALAEVPAGRSVVVYCSVGLRSAALAEALRASGRTGVRNLEGGIFRWAEHGRPLVDGAGPIRAVHPYDRRWGALLPAELRARVPGR